MGCNQSSQASPAAPDLARQEQERSLPQPMRIAKTLLVSRSVEKLSLRDAEAREAAAAEAQAAERAAAADAVPGESAAAPTSGEAPDPEVNVQAEVAEAEAEAEVQAATEVAAKTESEGKATQSGQPEAGAPMEAFQSNGARSSVSWEDPPKEGEEGDNSETLGAYRSRLRKGTPWHGGHAADGDLDTGREQGLLCASSGGVAATFPFSLCSGGGQNAGTTDDEEWTPTPQAS
eukprot:TRINITY_DN72932_c0_g1_i1.p1 TRINITY_DN72932_c0_g1~~TRINITY_DN72932_c0_g1_i1.p1  ORF type:complete len:270 (-),score=62.03 TRINITY_DN72932_c0_g1_i1:105-803(-)